MTGLSEFFGDDLVDMFGAPQVQYPIIAVRYRDFVEAPKGYDGPSSMIRLTSALSDSGYCRWRYDVACIPLSPQCRFKSWLHHRFGVENLRAAEARRDAMDRAEEALYVFRYSCRYPICACCCSQYKIFFLNTFMGGEY
jgi:hypothetical protein